MINDDIIRMARESGFHVAGGFVMPPHEGHITETIERFAALVADAEREACAKVCEEVKDKSGVNDDGRTWLQRATKHDCAAAIRARGK